MQRPTDEQIMIALCCGAKCQKGMNTGLCHRWDFDQETKRIRALLDRAGLSDEDVVIVPVNPINVTTN
jgi:hypothetical protein